MLRLLDIMTAQTPEQRAMHFAKLTAEKHLFQVACGGAFLSSTVLPGAQMSELEAYGLQAALEDILYFDQCCQQRTKEHLPAGFAEQYVEAFCPVFELVYACLTKDPQRLADTMREHAK